MFGGDGEWHTLTTTVTVTDVPALVVLPLEDAYGEEGSAVDLTAPDAWAGTPPWLDLIDQSTTRPTVDPASLTWSFGDGTTAAVPYGTPAPHLYAPGRYAARFTLTDTAGNTGSAAVNVDVTDLPPDVDAGPDRAVDVDSPVTFSGTAADYGGIAKVEWDFDYDGVRFQADPTATGTLTPSRTFRNPGVYFVALRATDAAGN